MAEPSPLSRAETLISSAVLLLATLTRWSDPPSHFQSGRFIPPDADSAMHWHRAQQWAADWPWPPLHQALLNFPEGAPLPWTPGWSAFLALCGALLSGGNAVSPLFAWGVALAPLLVGVATVAMVMALGRRLAGARAGLLGGLFLALTPQHVAATQFARCDHNAAEGFFLVAFALEAARSRPRSWALMLITAGACLAWIGAYAYVAIAAFAMMLAAWSERGEQPLQRAGVPGLLLGALLLAPLALKNGLEAGKPLDYAFLSGFQPAWILALSMGSAWLLALRTWPQHRRALLGGGGVCLLLAGLSLAPMISEGLRQWLARENPWLGTVQEMHPLLKGPPWLPSAWSVGTLTLGWSMPLLPLVAGVMLQRAWRAGQGGMVSLCVMGAALWLLTLTQVRFGWSLAPILATLMGCALGRAPVWGWLVVVGCFAQGRDALMTAYVMPKTQQNQVPWRFEAYRWLAEEGGAQDPQAPRWGVAGRWPHGHWITAIGRQPQQVGHFGHYSSGLQGYLDSERALTEGEEGLLAWMDEHALRYLVVDARELLERADALQVLLRGGSARGERPALQGLRPVMAGSEDPGARLPGAWVYERSAGARLVGVGEPGEEVRLQLSLFWGGEWRVWETRSEVDADGRWRLTVPIWTEARGRVPSGERAKVRCGSRQFSFPIPEEVVRSGGELRVGRRSHDL